MELERIGVSLPKQGGRHPVPFGHRRITTFVVTNLARAHRRLYPTFYALARVILYDGGGS